MYKRQVFNGTLTTKGGMVFVYGDIILGTGNPLTQVMLVRQSTNVMSGDTYMNIMIEG